MGKKEKPKLSERVKEISPPTRLKIYKAMDALVQKKLPVDNLMIGDPEFRTPSLILNAGKRALDKDKTFYVRDDGLLNLKKEAGKFYRAAFGLKYGIDQIAITTGAVNSIFLAIQLVCNPGDEIIVFAPHYLTYPAQIQMAGGVCKLVYNKPEDQYHLNIEAFQRAITSGTKAVILNSPCNPTGVVYGRSELLEIIEIAKKNNLWILSDEVYSTIVYENVEHVSPAILSPDAYDRTIVISSLSKIFGMTGWRVGITLGPREFMREYFNLIKHCTSCGNSIAQYTALTAFRKHEEVIHYYNEHYSKNREVLIESIQKGPCDFIFPYGAFYTLVDVCSYFGKVVNGRVIKTSLDFALALLQEEQVAVLGGEDFSAINTIRLSFATETESVRRGCQKLIKFMKKLENHHTSKEIV